MKRKQNKSTIYLRNIKNMKTDNYTKQAQANEMDGGSVSVHHLLTADEFIAQMEPRIRSMFR